MAPATSFISNCRYGNSQECPNTTVSVTFLGYCFTFFAVSTPAYVVNKAGFVSAFTFEVDIMQDDYSKFTSSKGAGIRVDTPCYWFL